MSRDRRRILIVDDNADAATSVAILLDIEGHHTTIAADGPSALRAIEVNMPDVVLLDIGLPGMDGYEVARRICLQPHLSTVKLVALTGFGEDHDRKRAEAAGFDCHLTKPVEPSKLYEAIGS